MSEKTTTLNEEGAALTRALAALSESEWLDGHGPANCEECERRCDIADDSGARCDAWVVRWSHYYIERARLLGHARTPSDQRGSHAD